MVLASERGDGIVSAGVAPSPDAGAREPQPAPRSSTSDRCAERFEMPVIKVNDQPYSLRPGANRLGAGDDADVRVGGDAALGIQAIIDVDRHDRVVIRRFGDQSTIRVNGVVLIEPAPLMHGDKVEIGGSELLYSDDSKAGVTQYISAEEIAAIARRRPGTPRATAATGGRLVSLVDGKDYTIPPAGLTIGRDASSVVVVAQNDVSRRHAEIAPVEQGYELRDFSANGVYVNGARVDAAIILSRSDVIRVGSEEFRFYADLASVAPVAPVVPVAKVAEAAGTPLPAPAEVVSTEAASAEAVSPEVVISELARGDPLPAPQPPVLATFEVTNEGPTKGQRYEVRLPLVHIGRGQHNDMILADDSVSDTHAKLQRRDDGWYLIDVGSTNGTYVGGHRIPAERRLDGAADLRFGGVKMAFKPDDAPGDASRGTRAIASVERSKLRETGRAAAVRPGGGRTGASNGAGSAAAVAPMPVAASVMAQRVDQAPRVRGWLVAILVLVGLGAALFLLNR